MSRGEMAPDEVDAIVEAWQRELPDADLSPMQVLSRINRLSHHLDRARKAAFATHHVEPWEFDVLSALRRSGKPYRLSPGRLVAETMVTSGTMTNRVDRLVERGLVERSADPSDRRGVLVSLTAQGRRTVDAALEELLARERGILSALAPEEAAQLADTLRELARSV